VLNVAMVGSIAAKVAARRGNFDLAVGRAEAAVATIQSTNNPFWIADAELALAEVLQVAGRGGEAGEAAERALALYEQKGVVPAIERTRAFLAELAPA
jgi:hypothetical protein